MAGEHNTLKENLDYIKEHTLQETADYLGIKISTVRSFVNTYEIPYVRRRYPEPDYAMEVLEYARHHSVSDAIKKYNATRNQILRWAKKHDMSVRNTDRINFFHGIPIEKVVDEVNETSLRAVSKKYGVTYQRVQQAIKNAGFTYKYVRDVV